MGETPHEFTNPANAHRNACSTEQSRGEVSRRRWLNPSTRGTEGDRSVLVKRKEQGCQPKAAGHLQGETIGNVGQDQEPWQLAALMHTPDERARFCSPEMQAQVGKPQGRAVSE